MSALIWVHMDALSNTHPVFDAAPDGAAALYIWDAEDVKARGWSLKRCVFVLESLDEMGVEIVEGRYAEVLAERDADAIYTARTPDPGLRQVIDEVGAKTVRDPAFASVGENADLKRFFRYWSKAKTSALSKTREGISA